ncbi:MAG TPA: helix-turn-helix domain-containing protein [Candidatus Binatia bacterium]|nr:helix-turn-helix domain-containing protein [Candidatus Binatia bacterium]
MPVRGRALPFHAQPCGVARTMDVVGEYWNCMLIRNVFLGVRRFEGLRANLGISRKVLAQRLDTLVQHGIVERRAYQDRPLRHEYRLTPMGVDLFPVLMALARWGNRWRAGGSGAAIEYEHKCGRVTPGRLVCTHCGDDLGAHNVRPRLPPAADAAYAASIEASAGRRVFLRG